jgi:hypothetical protein
MQSVPFSAGVAWLLLAGAPAVCLLDGCTGSGGATSAGATATTLAQPSVPSQPMTSPIPATGPSSAVKQPIHGLVSMGSTAFNNGGGGLPDNGMEEINAHPGVYAGAVINVLWSQLEPQQGVFDYSVIDNALAVIEAYNSKYPATPVVAKLRINSGIGTPGWVMQLTGGPITITAYSGTIQIGAFWSSTYRAAWQELQAHLAARYDSSSSMGEVAITSCSSRSSEPFIASLDAVSLAAMQQFGFNDATYMACLTDAANDYLPWQHTPLDFTFNSYRNSDGGTLVENPNFTLQVMESFRAAFGSRAVIANHGLQDPVTSAAAPIYSEFQVLGPPIEFQTISPTVDWASAIQWGLSYHPSEIEIWQTISAGGSANISQAQLQLWAGEI